MSIWEEITGKPKKSKEKEGVAMGAMGKWKG